jgi:hypothetical protein
LRDKTRTYGISPFSVSHKFVAKRKIAATCSATAIFDYL